MIFIVVTFDLIRLQILRRRRLTGCDSVKDYTGQQNQNKFLFVWYIQNILIHHTEKQPKFVLSKVGFCS